MSASTYSDRQGPSSARWCAVTYSQHVVFLLEHFARVDRRRLRPSEVVRDGGVEPRGDVAVGALLLVLHHRFELFEDLEALGDLALAQLAQRHLLHVDVVGFQRVLEHVRVEDQANQRLRRRVEFARGVDRAVLVLDDAGLLRGGRFVFFVLIVAVAGHVDKIVFARYFLEVASAVPCTEAKVARMSSVCGHLQSLRVLSLNLPLNSLTALSRVVNGPNILF